MKIAATHLLSNVITFYTIWKDAHNFYQNTADPYRLIVDPEGYPCFDYTDVESINKCEDPIIVIDCVIEGLNMKEYFLQYRNDRHYVMFVNGFWDQHRWDLKIDYTLLWFPFYFYDMADTYNSPQRFCYYLDKEYRFDYPKPLDFISTIGNVRPQRDQLVNKILENMDRDRFILRYSGQDLGVPSDEFDMIKFVPGEFDPYTSIVDKYYHNVSKSLPINLYNQSYFNLVVETDLDHEDSFFTTEKTIKSLIVGQPFVIISNPDHLHHLRKIGFRTFDSLWDESYDSIRDYSQRIDAVVELCKYLSTEFDWQANKQQLMEIKKHNLNVFQNLNPLINQCFIDIEKKLERFD